MASYIDRPFEILKLIRDRIITHVADLRISDAKSIYQSNVVINNLVRIGLVTCSPKGDLAPTERLQRIFTGLGVSLTQLSPFTSESVIASPVFGAPQAPIIKAEVLTVMPFTDELVPIYEDHIKPVVKELGLTIARGDDFFAATSIISDIWNSIYAAKVIIAECTGRNPNVFYEIGIAHTLGKPVVLLAQTKQDIPFDIQHLRSIIYDLSPKGRAEFAVKLKATITHEISSNISLPDMLRPRR